MARKIAVRPVEIGHQFSPPHHDAEPTPPVTLPRLALRLDELAQSCGVSRRSIERARAAGRFPKPDMHIGKMPLWRPETIRRWVEGGGR